MNEGFAKIRNGLKDHIDQGKMSATDLGVYTFLYLYCTWKTGIWFGNALNIAAKTLSSRRSISDSLHRLRQRGYINYATTRGRRGSYHILIDKFEPQYGPWEGYRLLLGNTRIKSKQLMKRFPIMNGGRNSRVRVRGRTPP